MAWGDLFAGLAFYLILEGLFPFVSPNGWRRSVQMLGQLEDKQVRGFGLACVIVGLIVLAIVRGV